MTSEPESCTLNTEAIESNIEWGQEWFLPKIDIMVREGVLVSDTRLQVITDAWNAYREDGGTRHSEAMDNFVGVIMNVVGGQR